MYSMRLHPVRYLSEHKSKYKTIKGKMFCFPIKTVHISISLERGLFDFLKVPFSHPIFIHPHRDDIGHEHNSNAPRKRGPNIITYRLI